MITIAMTATLTRDPEVKQHGEETVCEMRVAERNGGPKPVFITVAAFGEEAERCAEHLRKGHHVALSGRLRFREWEAKSGGKRAEHSIAAGRIEFLPGGRRTEVKDAPRKAPAVTAA